MCLNVVTALNAKKEPEVRGFFRTRVCARGAGLGKEGGSCNTEDIQILALSYLVNTSASIEGPSTDMKYYRNKACEWMRWW